MLPTVFSKLHPKYGSPTAAITLVGVLGLISPLLGKNALGWFVDASSFGTVVAYLTVSISFVMLRKKEPDLKRPWKAPGGYFTGFMAIVSCLFFIVLYLPIGPGALEWPYEWGDVYKRQGNQLGGSFGYFKKIIANLYFIYQIKIAHSGGNRRFL